MFKVMRFVYLTNLQEKVIVRQLIGWLRNLGSQIVETFAP